MTLNDKRLYTILSHVATWSVLFLLPMTFGPHNFPIILLPTAPVVAIFYLNYTWMASLYMDDHIAAGFGIQYGFYNAHFKAPRVSYTREENRLFTASSDSAGTWSSNAYMHTISIPLHFTFYPFANNHKFNLQLEMIPQFSFGHKLTQIYNRESTEMSINATYERDLPYSLFNLSTRLSINYKTFGLYAEYGITPTSRNIGFDNMTISPHNICVGIRINILELGRD